VGRIKPELAVLLPGLEAAEPVTVLPVPVPVPDIFLLCPKDARRISLVEEEEEEDEGGGGGADAVLRRLVSSCTGGGGGGTKNPSLLTITPE
jgi:hypothetical protein